MQEVLDLRPSASSSAKRKASPLPSANPRSRPTSSADKHKKGTVLGVPQQKNTAAKRLFWATALSSSVNRPPRVCLPPRPHICRKSPLFAICEPETNRICIKKATLRVFSVWLCVLRVVCFSPMFSYRATPFGNAFFCFICPLSHEWHELRQKDPAR